VKRASVTARSLKPAPEFARETPLGRLGLHSEATNSPLKYRMFITKGTLSVSDREDSMDATANSSLVDRRLAYGVFRLSLGVNILVHGAGRLFGPGAATFAAKTTSEFAGTPLPYGLVHAFLIALPFVEIVMGVLITLGLLTRWALTLGGLLITALVFGTALRSDWVTVGIQMIYAITYYLLLANLADDYFSLDTLLRRRHSPST
jgi:thiosulfate dehydrogenase [quinone] large subunit